MLTQTKDQVWQQTFEQVALTTDALGKRIDIGIMGLVLALNAYGIKTTASCEGHLDHGNPYPWVWVEKSSGEALSRMVKAFGGNLKISQIFDDTYQLTSSTSRLSEKQTEMQQFAEFLRDQFFEED
ncbi:MAG TPA: hypothetical protein VN207_12430 [Ktedonobacteraceae bacterium]|nr:hypothetical protein [Ktedonobacteraceae bacterium]